MPRHNRGVKKCSAEVQRYIHTAQWKKGECRVKTDRLCEHGCIFMHAGISHFLLKRAKLFYFLFEASLKTKVTEVRSVRLVTTKLGLVVTD